MFLQGSWPFIQCISRKAAGLPLAPLEVHTLVHAGCALIIYACWFEKPLDVRAPTIVPTAEFHNLIALMLMQSPRFGSTSYDNLDLPNDDDSCAPAGEESHKRSEASSLIYQDKAMSQSSRKGEANVVTDTVDEGPAGESHKQIWYSELLHQSGNSIIDTACKDSGPSEKYTNSISSEPECPVEIFFGVRTV